jgi:hypothetical protein
MQVSLSLKALERTITTLNEAFMKENCSIGISYGHLSKTELPKLETKLEAKAQHLNASLTALEAHFNTQPPPTATNLPATTPVEPCLDKCPPVEPHVNKRPVDEEDTVDDNHPNDLTNDVTAHTCGAYTSFHKRNSHPNSLATGDPAVSQHARSRSQFPNPYRPPCRTPPTTVSNHHP